MTSIPTATPPPTMAPVTTPRTTSIFSGSLIQGHLQGLNEVASTPPPTTPPPPPDPLEYEKTMYKNRIGEHDLAKLKEQVRILKGLPLTEEKCRHRIDRKKPPKMCPRHTFTSCKRKELQRHRMFVRCANLKEKYREYENSSKKEGVNIDELFRQLRNESMAKTAEQVHHEFDMEELENLKHLATKAKEQEVASFKETLGSQIRYKFNRGQPVISGNFRNAYDDFNKPPFYVCKNILRPKIYQLPKIDKQRETWYVPVDDEEGIPLHRQMKSPEPKQKGKRKIERPPVRRGNKLDKGTSEFKSSKEDESNQSATKRPPWRGVNYKSCSLNIA